MAVIRWDPFSALSRMDTDFDDLVRRTWGTASGATGYVPAIDMHAEGPDVVISFELPGVDMESGVDIEVVPGRLVVSGERSMSSADTEDSRRVIVREMRYGSFRREFALPEHVTAEDVDASYDSGVLTLRVSNVSKPKPKPVKIAVRNRPVVEGHVATGSSEVTEGDDASEG